MARPEDSVLLGCSARHGLCVHFAAEAERAIDQAPPAAPSVELAAGWLARTMAAGESFFDVAGALGLPPPLPDEQRGGDDRFDVYLVPSEPRQGAWPEPPSGAFVLDRSSAFARLAPPAPRDGCAFELRLARALAETSLLGLTAGVDEGTLGMHASYVATLAAPCAQEALDAVDAAQRTPEQGITHCGGTIACAGWPFSWYLDTTYGVAEPGAVMTAAIALARQSTPRQQPILAAEPDAFDVLRLAARDRGTSLDDIMLDFSVARAFLGSRSDEAHLPDAARLGSFGRVRFEWSVPWRSLPRRLAPREPIAPTGASYLWLDLDRASDEQSLLFEAEWAEGQLLRWALVKVDAEGREIGRVVPGVAYGQSRVQQTVSDLAGAAGLIVVGVAIGSDDRSHPFDPELSEPPVDYAVTLRRF